MYSWNKLSSYLANIEAIPFPSLSSPLSLFLSVCQYSSAVREFVNVCYWPSLICNWPMINKFPWLWGANGPIIHKMSTCIPDSRLSECRSYVKCLPLGLALMLQVFILPRCMWLGLDAGGLVYHFQIVIFFSPSSSLPLPLQLQALVKDVDHCFARFNLQQFYQVLFTYTIHI